jgi:hypothetical protein
MAGADVTGSPGCTWLGFLSLSGIRPSIGTENPVPEEMDHCKIAVRVSVMNKVQLLLAPKPCKPLKPRFLGVIFLIEKDMGVEDAAPAATITTKRLSGNKK